MTPPLPPPVWVDRIETLRQILPELQDQPRIAVDTESNSLHAYREQVCLIQFSTPDKDYLLDPLEIHDLSPLAGLFADPHIEKIFHAVEYDVLCLKRDFGYEIVNIFDTMQSARILGYPQFGLDAMLALKFDLTINKRYQKADWAYRPLTPEMLSYARLDTHYLLPLREMLFVELEATGLWELAKEEFCRLARLNGNHRSEVPTWQRISGKKKLSDRQLTILKELCEWRDKTAERLSRPSFKVIDDDRLIDVALIAPASLDDLSEALTDYQRRRFGSEILQSVKHGLHSPTVTRSRPVRPRQVILDRANALGQWRKEVAKKLHLESDIILPKAWMQSIAEQAPRTMEDLARIMPDSPWRLERFGADILKVIARIRSKS